MEKYMKKWSQEDIMELMKIMQRHGTKKGGVRAGRKFGRTPIACYNKYMELKRKMNKPTARVEFIDSKIDAVEKQFQAATKITPIETTKEAAPSPKIALLRNAKVLAQTNDILVIQEDKRVIVYNI